MCIFKGRPKAATNEHPIKSNTPGSRRATRARDVQSCIGFENSQQNASEGRFFAFTPEVIDDKKATRLVAVGGSWRCFWDPARTGA